MIGTFYIPDERATSPLDQSAPVGNANPSAAFPDTPSHFAAPGMSGDPWAEFPDWPPNFTATSNSDNPRTTSPAGSLPRYAHSAGPFTPVPNQNNIQPVGSRSDNMGHCLPLFVLCNDYHGNGPLIS